MILLKVPELRMSQILKVLLVKKQLVEFVHQFDVVESRIVDDKMLVKYLYLPQVEFIMHR